MKVGFLLVLSLVSFNISRSQSPKGNTGTTAKGSLTVRVTVVPSVWVKDPDRKKEVAVPNSRHVQLQAHARSDEVQFSFPTAQQPIEVTKQKIMMDVTEGGKSERRLVIVTTVVAQ
jgi:hypothetical protein